MAWDKDPRRSLRRVARRGAAQGRPAQCRGEALARHSQAYFCKRAQDRPFHRRAGRVGVRQFSRSQVAGCAWDVLPRPLPAHQDPPACAALRPDVTQSRRGDRIARHDTCRLPGRLRRLLSALQTCRFASNARRQRGHLSRPRNRHAVLRQGQIDGSHRRGILRQRDQRDAWLDERWQVCGTF